MSDTATASQSAPVIATGVVDTSAPMFPAEQQAFNDALAMLQGKDAPEAESTTSVAETVAESTPAAKPEETVNPVEAQMQRNMEHLRREGAKLEAQRQEMKAIVEENRKFKAAIEEARYNPKKVPEILGQTEEEFTRNVLRSGGEMSPEAKIAFEAKNEVKSLREALDNQQRQLQEQQQQAVLDGYRNDAAQFLQRSETHELTRAFGAVDAVMEEINNHYAKTYNPKTGAGDTLTYAQAADIVEQMFETEVQKRFGNVNKIRNLYGAPTPSKPATSKPAPRTITANMAGQTQPGREPTEAERMQIALKMITGGAAR